MRDTPKTHQAPSADTRAAAQLAESIRQIEKALLSEDLQPRRRAALAGSLARAKRAYSVLARLNST